MKEFLGGLWALIWAIIVSVFVLTLGTIYTLGYGLWFSRRAKQGNRWTSLFRYLWKLIDGWLAAIGHWFYETGYALDLGWNVSGEGIEDLITAEDDTTFSEKNISVSASVGKLEMEAKLNKTGKWLSKTLNFAFGQKSHAIGAWMFLQEKIRLKKELFNQES